MRVLFATRFLQEAETAVVAALQTQGADLIVILNSVPAALAEMINNPPDVLLTGFTFSGTTSELLITHATAHSIPVVLFTSHPFRGDDSWDEGITVIDKLQATPLEVVDKVVRANCNAA